jgi:hypothetical protein
VEADFPPKAAESTVTPFTKSCNDTVPSVLPTNNLRIEDFRA